MIDLTVGDIIKKDMTSGFSATVTKIDKEGIHCVPNWNRLIPEMPEFIWKDKYEKIANARNAQCSPVYFKKPTLDERLRPYHIMIGIVYSRMTKLGSREEFQVLLNHLVKEADDITSNHNS